MQQKEITILFFARDAEIAKKSWSKGGFSRGLTCGSPSQQNELLRLEKERMSKEKENIVKCVNIVHNWQRFA